MQILAVANQKGGVGKTTTSAALATILAALGWRVLGIDLDPQGHFCRALGVEPGPELATMMHERCARKVAPPDVAAHTVTVLPGLDLWRSDRSLADVEALELAGAMRRDYVLADLLAKVRDRYDVVIMDCPPSLDLLVINALTAAHRVVVPCVPEYLPLQGVSDLLNTIEDIRAGGLNPGLEVAGIVPTMVRRVGRNLISHHAQILSELRDSAGVPIFEPVPQRAAVADAAGQGVALAVADPDGDATRAYELLAVALFPEVSHA